MDVQNFFDPGTFTLTYVVFDWHTKDAVIIDPVLDFDPASGRIGYEALKKVVEFVRGKGLTVKGLLETHVHADHISGARTLQEKLYHNAPIAIGERITKVQATFKEIFNLQADFATDGSQFDQLMREGQRVRYGSIDVHTLFTPGHTPACASYYVNEEIVFTGDALFMPDSGTGRCDFPGGSAKELYHSITTKLYTLPTATRVFVGHDYQPGGRPLKFESTIGQQMENNIHLRSGVSESEFVAFRTGRDVTLSAPKLLYPSLQVNMAGGKFPTEEKSGRTFLKQPVYFASWE
jgi:glyoxylase-like metal-dependent hydrolase (beta-lactamase superfamily II)